MKKFYILIPVALLAVNLQAQFSSSSAYFPLAVGNKWIYKKFQYGSHEYTYLTVTITKDTIAGGKRYYYLSHEPPQSDYYIRYDSTNGILYHNVEMPHAHIKLSASAGDTTNYVCEAVYDTVFYGTQTRIKKYSKRESAPYNYYGSEIHTIKNFGQTYAYEYFTSPTTSNYVFAYLQGCVINSVIYGDTSSIIGIQTISGSVPEQFSLAQNYPNPFNPTTQIKFDIPKFSYVNIVIYDVSGREINKIVDEELNAGSYLVDWNASEYPSGVYFYKISAGDFVQTKKMVLAK